MLRSPVVRFAVALFVFVLHALSPRFADAQAVRGTVLGTITDKTGAVLPGVTVAVTNTETGVMQNTLSDAQGHYSVSDLQPGTYSVESSLTGFQKIIREGIRVVVGAQVPVDFSLGPSAVSETVTVSAAAPVVDTVSAALGTVVEQKQMTELPLADRSYSRLIVLAPGANEVPPATAGGQFQQFFGRQPQYTVSGARPEGQVFLMDNTNVQNYWNRGSGSGQLGTTLGVDAIAEYQVLTNTYSAQFGGNGVAINAITKSGTNQFHGSIFEYYRNNKLDASNFFDQLLGRPDPTFNKNQFGVSQGGPLVKNKAFYFFNYEGLRQTLGTTQVITVPDGNARGGVVNGVRVGVSPVIAPVLALYPLPTRQSAAQAAQGVGQTDVTNSVAGHENYFVGRVDYTITNRTSLFARYTGDVASVAEPNSGSPIPLWNSNDETGNHYVTAELRHVLRPSLLSSLRVGVTRTQEAATRTDLDNGLLTFFPGRLDGTVAAGSGIVGLGGNQVLPFTQRQTRFVIADDIAWTASGHTLKVGFEYERQQTFVNLPLFGDGAWTFPSLTAFLQNQPSLFLGALPGQNDAARNIDEWRLTTYAQDEWRLGQRVTLNLGLRYDPRGNPTLDKGQTLVSGVTSTGFTSVTQAFAHNPTLNNWEPRLGIAFDPANDHRTAIRAGYGIFHSTITANRLGPAYGVNPPFAIGAQVRIPIPGIPVPVFPTPNPSASQISLMQGLDYDVQSEPRLQQWNVNIQRELAANTSVTLAYVGSHGDHLQQQRDTNPVLPRTLADGTLVYGSRAGAQTVSNARLNPVFAALTSGNTIAESSYQSFQAALNRRFEHGIQSQISYTLSRCRDTSSGNSLFEGGQVATNPYDLGYDYGPCQIDRTHNLRASAVYQLPFQANRLVDGWQVSAIVTAVSGAPFTPAIGFDQSGLQTAGQRPNLAGGRSLDNIVTGGTVDATCGCITQYFDPTAFTLPAAGTLGTSVGRNSLRGPGLFTVDLGVSKNVAFAARGTYVQLRLEVFNLFNRVNYGGPNPTIFIATADGTAAPNPTAGQITTALAPRQVQLAVKLVF
ncbi:MAG TPA: TonB-dependent receptor [Vicinamibacterales bacterium]|nr:TonB-dependent receptor [Vicinamibacterales bacterium]